MPRNLSCFSVLTAVLGFTLSACAGEQNAGQPVSLPVTAPADQSALSPAITQVDWPMWGFDRQRTGFNPNERILGPGNVSGLTLKWSFALGTTIANTQPIVASNVQLQNGTLAQVVYVADEAADFYAVHASNGKLLWSKKLGRQDTACVNGSVRSEGVTSAPVIDRTTNRVYVLDAKGMLSAFNLATGQQATGFPPVVAFSNANNNHTWSGLLLTADGKTLYYPTASRCDEDIYYGTVNAINTTTQVIKTFHVVTNPSQYYGDGVWSWGGESIDPSNGNLYAGVGNAQGSSLGESAPNSDSVLELTGTLGFVADEQPITISPTQTEMDISTTPVVYDDQGSCIAVQRKDGHFFTIVRTALANGNFVTDLNLGGFDDTPAYDPVTHALYVNVPHGLAKLNVGANCAVSLAWQTKSLGATGFQVPVIADGVVYAAGKNVLYAINARTGAILWNSGTTITGTIAAAPSVVNGRVYVTSWDGHLYAFGL